jgi:hypothetical protein
VIQNYFTQAELALAAYANLTTTRPDEAALIDAGMTSIQASAFAAKWNVVDHQYNDPITGLSATVFQAVSGGPKYLAVRGTDFGLDFIVDYLILNGVPSALNPQYQSLKTQVQTWMGDGTLSAGFTVTGHSLGGYLAAGLVANFGSSISHAYLYNAPGNNSTIQVISQALGLSATPDASKISSLRADAGISPIAGLGNDFSPPISIHIENQFFSDVNDPPDSMNHSQRVLTDSLALYANFAQIDPTVSVDSITKIIESASAQNGNTLELTLDALRTLFQQNYQYGQLEYDAVPTMLGDSAAGRNDYYGNLQSLQTWLKDNPQSGLSIQPLSGVNATQIASLALADTVEGMAYRYALYKLNPFVVTGTPALYDGINTHNELKLYTPTSNTGIFTEQYLKDRAAMLTWKLSFGTQDTEPVGDTFVKPQDGTPFYFEDFTSNAITTKMRIGGGDSVNAVMSRPLGDFNLIVFGSENDDLVTGQGKDDRLHGGGWRIDDGFWKEAA